jgi:hypothetical protein
VPAVVGIGAVAAEKSAHSSLDGDLRSAVARVLPGERVQETNVRGRPYLVSRLEDRVSTAYVSLVPDARAVERTLLVQELDLATGRARQLRYFVTLPYAAGARGVPVRDSAGAYTDRASVDGRRVRYSAALDGDTVRVSASSGSSPKAVKSLQVKGMHLVGKPAAKEGGVLVELVAADVPTRRS